MSESYGNLSKTSRGSGTSDEISDQENLQKQIVELALHWGPIVELAHFIWGRYFLYSLGEGVR